MYRRMGDQRPDARIRFSLTQFETGQLKMPYSDRTITLTKVGCVVVANAYITLASSFKSVGNVAVNEKIPEGFRPADGTNAVLHGFDNGGDAIFYLVGSPDGSMQLNGTGNAGRFIGVSGCWIAVCNRS